MFPLRRRTLSFGLAALLGLAASPLAACGDSGQEGGRELKRATASQLQATLDEIEQTTASGDCDRAAAQAAALMQQASSLPADVSADLRDALTSGARRLQSLVGNQCEPAPAPTEAPPTEAEPQGEQGDEDQQKPKKPKKPKETEPQDEEQGGDQQQDGGAEGGAGGGDQGAGPGTGGVTP